jgi:RHS repeat-associated protein
VYDALNRLKHKGYPDSTGVDYVYDLVGKIKSATDPTGTYGFAYDNMGRLIGTTTQYTFLPGNTYSNGYTYDAASNRTGFTAPDGSTNTYAYDNLNRLTSLTNSLTGQFGFGYDTLSRRTSLTRPNNVSTSYSYDSLSRLLSILHQAGGVTIDGASYTLDNAGNRTSKINQLNGITENYTYDPIYQLTQVQQVVSGSTNTTENYSYDAVGNRLSSLNIASYSYANSNELTSSSDGNSYTYDFNGNTLTKSNSSGTTQYVWDFENRLTSVTLPNGGGVVTLKYDPFGRRVQKSGPNGTTNFLYDGANSLTETDSTGSYLATYTQGEGVDEPLAELRAGTSGFFHGDGLGSITSLSSNNAQIANIYSYSAFGMLVSSSGGLVNPLRYTARDWDGETGLQYTRARYYDAGIGRFINEDPLGFPGSGTDFYAYAFNDPTSLNDAFGLSPCPPKRCKKCSTRVQAAVNAKIGFPVTYLGPTEFPADTSGTDPSDPGMRNGACNFNFFVPGYTPHLMDCGRYSPNFTGIGPSLHIVHPPGKCNILSDPTIYAVDDTGFYFTAHMDSGNASIRTPFGLVWHNIVDVLLKIKHGC